MLLFGHVQSSIERCTISFGYESQLHRSDICDVCGVVSPLNFDFWAEKQKMLPIMTRGMQAVSAACCQSGGWHGDRAQAYTCTFGWSFGWRVRRRFTVIMKHNEAVSIHQPWTISISASHSTPCLFALWTAMDSNGDSQRTLIALKRCQWLRVIRQSFKIHVRSMLPTARLC